MIDLSGIWYRVYAEVPLIFLTGVIIFAFDIAAIRKKHKKGIKAGIENTLSCLIGLAAICGSVILCAHYVQIATTPDVSSMDCIFLEQYRDSMVAPPLPFTDGYVFREMDEADSTIVYLDCFSAKKIVPQELLKREKYTVWYTSSENIIVRLELAS